MTWAHGRDTLAGVLKAEDQAPAPGMRIVLELSSEDGNVSGTLTTADGRQPFWGWLELMSALELAATTHAQPARSQTARGK